MGHPYKADHICAICKKSSRQVYAVNFRSQEGPFDLDGRVHNERLYWCTYIHTCPFCHYSSEHITDMTTATESSLQNIWKQMPDMIDPSAQAFFASYKILASENKHEKAYYALLNAIWVCDDCDDRSGGDNCRQEILDYLKQYLDNLYNEKLDPPEWISLTRLALVMTEYNRQLGSFESAKELCKSTPFGGLWFKFLTLYERILIWKEKTCKASEADLKVLVWIYSFRKYIRKLRYFGERHGFILTY